MTISDAVLFVRALLDRLPGEYQRRARMLLGHARGSDEEIEVRILATTDPLRQADNVLTQLVHERRWPDASCRAALATLHYRTGCFRHGMP